MLCWSGSGRQSKAVSWAGGSKRVRAAADTVSFLQALSRLFRDLLSPHASKVTGGHCNQAEVEAGEGSPVTGLFFGPPTASIRQPRFTGTRQLPGSRTHQPGTQGAGIIGCRSEGMLAKER